MFFKSFKFYLCVFFYAVIVTITDINCPIKFLTGTECPTCGVTRALISLLKFDIKTSLDFNPMALFIVFSFLVILNQKYIKKKAIINIAFLILLLNYIFYLIKLTIFY